MKKQLLLILALFTITAFAQHWTTDVLEAGKSYRIADYTVRSLQLKQDESSWDFFMHGILDNAATPVAWQALGVSEKLLDAEATIDTPVKASQLPALKLTAPAMLDLQTPLLDAKTLYENRGNCIRIFYWLKAEETGKDAPLWDSAPQMTVYIQNANGSILTHQNTFAKTRGTFPWFCYHIDVQIPLYIEKPSSSKPAQKAAEAQDEDQDVIFLATTEEASFQHFPKAQGLFLSLANTASGTAWFSTVSWQKLPLRESLENTRKLRFHPKLNTLAPNAEHDELPLHFLFGLAPKGNWTWAKGTKVLPNLTTKAALMQIFQTAQNDWSYMLHAVPYLASFVNNGRLLKTMPDFETGWEDTLLTFLTNAQNPETGMWGANNRPDLFATNAIAQNSFLPDLSYRIDSDVKTPWLSIQNKTLPRPVEIVRTILDARNVIDGKTTGWDDATFQEDRLPADFPFSPCDIAASCCAINLLNQALPFVKDENLANQAWEAIRDTRDFILNKMVRKDGLWVSSAKNKLPTTPDLFFMLLDNSNWLDVHVNDNLPKPKLSSLVVDTVDERMRFSWDNHQLDDYVSLRIYVAPKKVPNEKLTPKYLAAVILKPTNSIVRTDPLKAAKTITGAAFQKWGYTPAADGAVLFAKKLAEIPKKLPILTTFSNLSVKLVQGKKTQTIRVAAVNASGEHSPFLVMQETIPGTEGDDEDETETEPETTD